MHYINQKTNDMELQKAQDLANELLELHGLSDMGWTFMWDRAKGRLGSCQYRRKHITLSVHVTNVNDVSSVRNTILHEIAHAIVGQGHGHDSMWRMTAMEIGCNGDRCSSIEGKIESKWIAECHGCGATRTAHRRKKRISSCGTCSGGTFNHDYLLEYKLNPNY